MTREDAKVFMRKVWRETTKGSYAEEAYEMAIKALEQPTVEPERKKGKWIDEGFYADGHGAHAFRCSECGGHIIEYDADPFCKWCGADMRGEEDNIPIEYFESGGK
jgi:hypothetical protein